MSHGHQKWPWLMPALEKLEGEFETLSYDALRQRLRRIYIRLSQEIES